MFNVLFASNDIFSPYLGVAIYSLLSNNVGDFDKINIYIFDDNISKSNKLKLYEVVNLFNQNLTFIPVVDIKSIVGENIHFMEKEEVFSLTTYARLFASSILKDIDKILYLDADSLTVGSFKELWDLDINKYYVAGVMDLLGVNYIKQQINLDINNNYINAGVLLINLNKWREDNLEEKFIEFLIDNLDHFIFHDQGVINGVCKNKILYLDPKYNLQGQFHGINYKKAIKWAGFKNFYTKDKIVNAQNNPIFIHFTGALNRPWSNDKQFYYKLYWEYVKKTPFKDEIKFKSISYLSKLMYYIYKSFIMSLILKLIPMSLMVSIANNRIKKVCENELK